MGRTACTEHQCLYKGALYLTVELYLYSPYGLYGLYRASVPVQGCTLLLYKCLIFDFHYEVEYFRLRYPEDGGNVFFRNVGKYL